MVQPESEDTWIPENSNRTLLSTLNPDDGYSFNKKSQNHETHKRLNSGNSSQVKSVSKAQNQRKETQKENISNFNVYSLLKNDEGLEESVDDAEALTVKKNRIKKVSKKLGVSKKKTKLTFSKKVKVKDKTKQSTSEENPILRCCNCSKTHFPHTKFCTWTILRKIRLLNEVEVQEAKQFILDDRVKKILLNAISYLETKFESLQKSSQNEHIRLQGGYGDGTTCSLLVTRAIQSAKKHGVNLVEGKLNKADGNCAFDVVINNINYRSCFKEKLHLASMIYRQIWITELEDASDQYPSLGAGYSKEERCENWNRLKQFGVYEIDFFGDFVMHAIAKGCNKNILVFNTSEEASDPVYVIKAEEFGGFADTDIPVVVGYNQVHYESLHPVTDLDIEETKRLVHSFIAGNYTYCKKDIPFLISSKSEETKKAREGSSSSKLFYDIAFPPLQSKGKKMSKMSKNRGEENLDEKQKNIENHEINKMKRGIEENEKENTRCPMKKGKSEITVEKEKKNEIYNRKGGGF